MNEIVMNKKVLNFMWFGTFYRKCKIFIAMLPVSLPCEETKLSVLLLRSFCKRGMLLFSNYQPNAEVIKVLWANKPPLYHFYFTNSHSIKKD